MLGNLFAHEESDELRQRQGIPAAQNRIGAHALAEHRIGHRHASDVLHRRMGENEIFDFFGADLFAAAVDKVFLASFDYIISRRMEPHQIAGSIIKRISSAGNTAICVTRWRSINAKMSSLRVEFDKTILPPCKR